MRCHDPTYIRKQRRGEKVLGEGKYVEKIIRGGMGVDVEGLQIGCQGLGP